MNEVGISLIHLKIFSLSLSLGAERFSIMTEESCLLFLLLSFILRFAFVLPSLFLRSIAKEFYRICFLVRTDLQRIHNGITSDLLLTKEIFNQRC